MNIILLGYMGCGKSLIGSSLAERLQMNYLDLDDYITSKEKRTIPEIFMNKGEIYFRKRETQYLEEILETSQNSIISLGGGTPCFAGNMDLINAYPNVHSVYLKTSIPELVHRLFPEKNKRPLIAHLQNHEELTEFIGKHLFERSFYYTKALHTVTTDNKAPGTIATEIQKLLIRE